MIVGEIGSWMFLGISTSNKNCRISLQGQCFVHISNDISDDMSQAELGVLDLAQQRVLDSAVEPLRRPKNPMNS